MAEMIYETTIDDYKSVIGALPANTVDTPYTVRITDIENLTTTNLNATIKNSNRYVSIIWKENDIWRGVSARNMFSGCTSLTSIDTTPFTNVTDATRMFTSCSSLKYIDTSGLCNITKADTTFAGCSSLLEINTTPFSNLTNAYQMFIECKSLTSIDTSAFFNVTNAYYMFNRCSNLKEIDITPFNKVTSCQDMFTGNTHLSSITISDHTKPAVLVQEYLPKSITDIYFTEETYFENIFNSVLIESLQTKNIHYNIKIIETIIADYNTKVGSIPQNTVDTPYTVRITDIENLTTSLISAINNANRYVNIRWKENDIWDGTNATFMFSNCALLTTIDTTPFTNVTNASYMFDGCTGLTSIDTSPFTNVTIASSMFSRCTSLTSIDTSPFTNVTIALGMFDECTGLTSIDTSSFTNVTNASGMFRKCTSLTSIDITPFTNVINASIMFFGCTSLTDIYISDMSHGLNSVVTSVIPETITDIYFPNDYKSFSVEYEDYLDPYTNLHNKTLHYELSDAVPKVTTLDRYARNVSSLEDNYSNNPYQIKVTDFKDHVSTEFAEAIKGGDRYVDLTFDDDVYELDDGSSMFKDCPKLTSVSTSPFKDVINASSMFEGCSELTIIDTSPFTDVINASSMFEGCSGLTAIDTTAFSKVIDASSMFEGCSLLKEVDTTAFSKVKDASNCFKNVPLLRDLDETKFTALENAEGMFDGTLKETFDFTGSKNLKILTLPDSAVSLIAKGTKLESLDLSNTVNLEFLDVSDTDLKEINILDCEKLPYCGFRYEGDKRILIKGWLAQRCTSLETVHARQDQVQDSIENPNLKNDINTLEGCTALKNVEITCKSAPSYSGRETHYGEVRFENDLIYKGKKLEEYLPESPEGTDYIIDLCIKHSGVLGELRYFPDTDFHRGFMYCDGSVFLPEVYPDFYVFWKKHFENKCGYDRMGYPRLPDFRGMYIRGSRDGDKAFEFEPESLPNIKALVGCASEGLFNGRGAMTTDGAFELEGSNNYCGGDNSDRGRPHTLKFNASKSNRTYGRQARDLEVDKKNVVVNNINSYIYIKVI